VSTRIPPESGAGPPGDAGPGSAGTPTRRDTAREASAPGSSAREAGPARDEPASGGSTAGAGARPRRGSADRDAQRPSAAVPPRPARDTERRKAPLGWLPWALLAALLVLLALLLVVGLLVGVGRQDAAQPATAPGSAQQDTGQAGEQPARDPDLLQAQPGQLVTGSTDLLATAPTAGQLSGFDQQTVAGRAVPVESVVTDEGFWVGTSDTERVFVFLSQEARGGPGESAVTVEPGQRVDLDGTVVAVQVGAGAQLGLTDVSGQAQLEEQGGYVRATDIQPAE
jgi:hypothetical protein